jgi:hypothetical protein
MSDRDPDDPYRHPTLGELRSDWNLHGWIGRWRLEGYWCDLFVAEPEGYEPPDTWRDDDPPPEAVAPLVEAVGRLDRVAEAALEAIRRFRTGTLGFNAGPPADLWSITGLMVDARGELWIVLHEYETDEYSAWWARIRGVEAVEARRGIAGGGYVLPALHPPGETGWPQGPPPDPR